MRGHRRGKDSSGTCEAERLPGWQNGGKTHGATDSLSAGNGLGNTVEMKEMPESGRKKRGRHDDAPDNAPGRPIQRHEFENMLQRREI